MKDQFNDLLLCQIYDRVLTVTTKPLIKMPRKNTINITSGYIHDD